MHFGMKSYLKSNRNHTAKHILNCGPKFSWENGLRVITWGVQLKRLFKEGLDLEYGCSMRANLSIYLAFSGGGRGACRGPGPYKEMSLPCKCLIKVTEIFFWPP